MKISCKNLKQLLHHMLKIIKIRHTSRSNIFSIGLIGEHILLPYVTSLNFTTLNVLAHNDWAWHYYTKLTSNISLRKESSWTQYHGIEIFLVKLAGLVLLGILGTPAPHSPTPQGIAGVDIGSKNIGSISLLSEYSRVFSFIPSSLQNFFFKKHSSGNLRERV
jgi:hypothetical protein